MDEALAQQITNAFWQFSLQHYGKTELQQLLLSLQDQHQLNINLLLWLLFCNTQQRKVSLSSLQNALVSSDQQLSHFRQQRRSFKQVLDKAHYQLVLKHELKLEQRQQALLVSASLQNQAETILAKQALVEYLHPAAPTANAERLLALVAA